jgi:GR25 family glycosyltransferase involved in LPS biosynthesis
MIKTFIILILLLIFITFHKKYNNEFFNNFQTEYYVIHMNNNDSRYKNIKDQEKKANINIKIFSAVDGSKVNINNLENDLSIKLPWDTYRYNNEKDKNIKKKIMNGEIGCYLSHFNLLNKIANSSYDGWTIIFEDDFKLKNNFKNELNKILKNINNNIDIIYLGNVNQFTCSKGKFKDNLCYPDIPWGTQGYMVNRKSARKILNLIKYIDMPIDHKYISLMDSKKINGLVVIPVLVNQDNKDIQSIIIGK